MDNELNLNKETFVINRFQKEQLNGHKSFVLWFTGFPFSYKGQVHGLKDSLGDERFITTSIELNKKLSYQPVKAIFSFKQGFILVYQLKYNSTLYFSDFSTGHSYSVLENVTNVHSVVQAPDSKKLIINYDDKLVIHDLKSRENYTAARNPGKHSMTPSISGNKLFFASNTNAEFFRIFSVDLTDPKLEVKNFYSETADLRQPILEGGSLFFLRIKNGMYLLNSLDLTTRKHVAITSTGVVYGYKIVSNGKIIYSWSDTLEPKRLMSYSIQQRRETLLIGNSAAINSVKSTRLKFNELSEAYYMTNTQQPSRATLIFIHPGQDYSPRWDPILINLVRHGYDILAPNYPTSIGYGQTFYNMPLDSAVQDINNWTEVMNRCKPNSRIFFITYSSGNPLMEKVVSENRKNVSGVISLFGLNGLSNKVISLPALYVLGKNDERVPYNARIMSLKYIIPDARDLHIQTYSDEGHMIRNASNLTTLLTRIDLFIAANISL